jgi:RIO-like serine/threonine protein kinase
MIKAEINSKYKHLEESILEIPKNFDTVGKTIYEGRNTLKVVEIDGIKICIKAFKKPNFINKWVYIYFRKSKACRSYEYAMKLQEFGINTPEAVAYIEEKDVVLKASYYICLFEEYDFTLRELYDDQIAEREEIFEELIDFTYGLHRNNVLHTDYSPGNVLIKKQAGQWHCSVVDINRMQFRKVNLTIALKNLSKIWAADYMYAIIAKKYSKFYHTEYDKVFQLYQKMELKHKAKTERKKKIKSFIKSIFKR